MLNLNDLYFFAQSVNHGGFAAAARALGIPKSTLSKRTAALEAELGVRLVNRTSRNFVLTEIGEEFFRHASAALIEAEAAENLVMGRRSEPSGTVRLTCSVPTAQITLGDVLPKIAVAYPGIQLELHVSDRFVDIVQEGFDIAVRDHFAPLPDSELVQRSLGSQPIYLVAAHDYVSRRGMPIAPADLRDHDGLLVNVRSYSWTLVNPRGETVEVRPMRRFTADESSLLLNATASGLGIACLPEKLCKPALESGHLVRVLPEWIAGEVFTTLLLPSRRGQLPSVRAVCDFIAEELKRGRASEARHV